MAEGQFTRRTQGKIERYHRSMKSIVKLNRFFFPWELAQAIADFVAYYNDERYHYSLDNVTPADVFLGRQEEVLTQRELIKQQILLERTQNHPASRGLHGIVVLKNLRQLWSGSVPKISKMYT